MFCLNLSKMAIYPQISLNTGRFSFAKRKFFSHILPVLHFRAFFRSVFVVDLAGGANAALGGANAALGTFCRWWIICKL